MGQKRPDLSDQARYELTQTYLNADRERILGNNQEAFRLYAACVEKNPAMDAAYYQMGKLFFAQKQMDAAQAHFQRAAAIDPANHWYKLELAQALAEQQKFKQSAAVFKDLRALDPQNPDWILSHANLQLYSGDYKGAMKSFDEVEKILGPSAEVSMTKYRYFISKDKAKEAEAELHKMIAAFPEDVQWYGHLADFYKSRGEMEKALLMYEKALLVDPNNGYIRLSLAEYYERTNRPDTAYAHLKIAFRNADLDIDTKVGMLLRMYNPSVENPNLRHRAISLCEELAVAHPKEAKAYSVFGDFLYLDGQNDAAREQYRTAIELDPSRYALWNQLLVIDSQLGDNKGLAEDSEKALEIFPVQPTLYFYSGIAHKQIRNYELAAKRLKQGSELVIANPELLVQLLSVLGDVENERGRYASSDSAFDQALLIDPKNVYVLNNYAYFLSLRKDKLEQAKSMSKITLEQEPMNASYLDTYGWIRYAQGAFEEAEATIKQALNLGGSASAEVLDHYGDVLFRLNHKEEALNYWKQALEKDSANATIAKKIADGALEE